MLATAGTKCAVPAVDAEVLEQPLEEVRQASNRVVQVAALSRPSKADQVGSNPAAALEE